MKLLVDRPDQLVRSRTAAINQLRWHVHLIDPSCDPTRSSLTHAKGQRQLVEFIAAHTGIDARMASDLLADIIRLTSQINTLDGEITPLVQTQAPQLLTLPGCGALTAAKIIGETAGVARFRSEHCFAMHAGAAPIPLWSGRTAGRHRLSKYGNRQLNAALHRIAITQARLEGPGKTYIAKRLTNNNTKPEAIRCLKRRLCRTVYNLLRATS